MMLTIRIWLLQLQCHNQNKSLFMNKAAGKLLIDQNIVLQIFSEYFRTLFTYFCTCPNESNSAFHNTFRFNVALQKIKVSILQFREICYQRCQSNAPYVKKFTVLRHNKSCSQLISCIDLGRDNYLVKAVITSCDYNIYRIFDEWKDKAAAWNKFRGPLKASSSASSSQKMFSESAVIL